MNIRETLSVHLPSNQETRPEDETGGLDVCGMVERPRVPSAPELATLPRIRRVKAHVGAAMNSVDNRVADCAGRHAQRGRGRTEHKE